MDIDAVIQQGWAEHGRDPEAVAGRLVDTAAHVTDGDQAARLMQLAGHVLGDHLGRRADAARLCEAAFQGAGEEPGTSARVHLAVARGMAGDEDGARAALGVLAEDPVQRHRVGLLRAQAHAYAGDWEPAATRYARHMDALDALPEGHALERSCAVVANNVASEVLEQGTREPQAERLMRRAAEDARTYWTRVGTWLNDARADYLLSRVHQRLARAEDALMHADRGLATITEAKGEEPVDEAFLHVARAAACRDLDLADEQAASIAQAEHRMRPVEDEGLLGWFRDELAKAR